MTNNTGKRVLPTSVPANRAAGAENKRGRMTPVKVRLTPVRGF
jgi:hypothetical protein